MLFGIDYTYLLALFVNQCYWWVNVLPGTRNSGGPVPGENLTECNTGTRLSRHCTKGNFYIHVPVVTNYKITLSIFNRMPWFSNIKCFELKYYPNICNIYEAVSKIKVKLVPGLTLQLKIKPTLLSIIFWSDANDLLRILQKCGNRGWALRFFYFICQYFQYIIFNFALYDLFGL